MSNAPTYRSTEEYQMMWGCLTGQLHILDQLPLDDMLACVRHAETAGPFLDPTAFRAGAHNLPPQREILEAAITLRDVARRHREGLRAAARPAAPPPSSPPGSGFFTMGG